MQKLFFAFCIVFLILPWQLNGKLHKQSYSSEQVSILVNRTTWEVNCHGRAVSRIAFDLNASTVLLNDRGAVCKPET